MTNQVYELLVRIMGDSASLNTALRDADEKTKASLGAMQQYAQGASIALAGIAIASGAMVGNLLQQAGQMETYRTKLTTVFKDAAKAAETMKWAVEFAAKTPFEVKGIVDATVTLSVYRQKAQEILPLVGDLAAAMGARIEDTAQAVGKAMSGSLEGWEMLRNTYGVTIERLKAFGAAIDGQGQMLTKNSNDLERNRKALLAVIATDFGGGMERQSKTFTGAMSNLNDAISNFKVSVGETLIPAATGAAQSITGMVGALQKIPEPLRAVGGFGLVATAGITALGAGMLGAISILGPGAMMLVNIAEKTQIVGQMAALSGAEIKGFAAIQTVLRSALMSSTAALLGWGAVAIGAALAVKAVQDEWIKAAEAEDKLTKSTSENIAVTRQAAHWIGKTGEELRSMGVALADIPKAMDGFRELAKAAREIGREDLAQKYMGQMRAVRDAGTALSEYSKKVEEGYKAAQDAAKLTEHNAKLGLASAKDLLEAENAKLSAMRAYGATKDEIWTQEEKVAELRKKVEEDEQKQIEKTAKAHEDAGARKMAPSLHFIERKKALNQMSEAEELAALQRILRYHELTAEQRKGIVERMEDVAKKRSDDARAKKIANLEAEKKKAEEVREAAIKVAEDAYKRKVEILNAEVAAFRKAREDEIALIQWRTQGELNEEAKLLAAKMQRLKDDTVMLVAMERALRIDGKTAEADAIKAKIDANNEAIGKLQESAAKNQSARWAETWKQSFAETEKAAKQSIETSGEKTGVRADKDAAAYKEQAMAAGETAEWYDKQAEKLEAARKALLAKKDITAADRAQLEQINVLLEEAKRKQQEFYDIAAEAQRKQAEAVANFQKTLGDNQKANNAYIAEQADKEEAAADERANAEKKRATESAEFGETERRKQLRKSIDAAGRPTEAMAQAGLRSAIEEESGLEGKSRLAALRKDYEEKGLLGTQQYKDAVTQAETEIRLAKLKTLEDHGIALKADYDAAVKYLTDLINLLPKYGAAWQAVNAQLTQVKKDAVPAASPAGAISSPAASTTTPGPDLGTQKTTTPGPTYSPAAGPYPSITPEYAQQQQAAKQQTHDAAKAAAKQDKAADKQEDAGESLFKGATSSAQAAQKLDAAAQRIADYMNALARETNYRSGMMGGISLAGAGGFFGGGGLGGISDIERGSMGPTARSGSGGYEWGMAEKGRMVSTQELMRLRRTEGWNESGNSWTDMGNGQWWVTSPRGEPPPSKEKAVGFGSAINLKANIRHVPGTGSVFDVESTEEGGPGYFAGRTGASSMPAPTPSPPITRGPVYASGERAVKVEIPLYIDGRKVGGAIADNVLAQGSGAMSFDAQAAFSS